MPDKPKSLLLLRSKWKYICMLFRWISHCNIFKCMLYAFVCWFVWKVVSAGVTPCETHLRRHGFEKWKRIKVSGRKLLTSNVHIDSRLFFALINWRLYLNEGSQTSKIHCFLISKCWFCGVFFFFFLHGTRECCIIILFWSWSFR